MHLFFCEGPVLNCQVVQKTADDFRWWDTTIFDIQFKLLISGLLLIEHRLHELGRVESHKFIVQVDRVKVSQLRHRAVCPVLANKHL